ncbi:MAG: hypothetical protein QM777_07065 [Pseudorhodoferax sp.]
MTRARFVLGDPTHCGRASTPCAAPCVTARATRQALRSEIIAMREKVRAAHPVRGGHSTSSTAPAAWSTPSSPCSTWCCRSPPGTPS